MKRTVLLLMVVGIVISLFGCSEDQNITSSIEDEQSYSSSAVQSESESTQKEPKDDPYIYGGNYCVLKPDGTRQLLHETGFKYDNIRLMKGDLEDTPILTSGDKLIYSSKDDFWLKVSGIHAYPVCHEGYTVPVIVNYNYKDEGEGLPLDLKFTDHDFFYKKGIDYNREYYRFEDMRDVKLVSPVLEIIDANEACGSRARHSSTDKEYHAFYSFSKSQQVTFEYYEGTFLSEITLPANFAFYTLCDHAHGSNRIGAIELTYELTTDGYVEIDISGLSNGTYLLNGLDDDVYKDYALVISK